MDHDWLLPLNNASWTYIYAVFYVISNNLCPVAVHTTQKFTCILTAKVLMNSHRQIIVKKVYLKMCVMVQDTA